MYVELIQPYGDREAGDVINVPATLARSLIFNGTARGGSIRIASAKPVNLVQEPKRAIQAGPTRQEPEPEVHKEVVYPKRTKPVQGTVNEIKSWLDQHDIAYDPRARKAQLLELLRKA